MRIASSIRATPRAVNSAVKIYLLTPLFFQSINYMADILDMFFVSDQDSIICFNNYMFGKACSGNQSAGCVDIAISSFIGQHISLDNIAMLILLANIPQRFPGSYI